ncbi:MAG: hypothetical protein U9R21_09025 [Candidatus Thermoplasmatota archaeon]|nr:hypothetical protein [Candidatus Thermoplasmatota archaeon]
MKEGLFRKGLVIVVIALFATVYIFPAIANEQIEEKACEEIINVEYTSIDFDGSTIGEKFSISEQEFTDLKTRLSSLFDALKSKTDSKDVIDVLTSFLDRNDHPLLNKILKSILNSEILGNRKLVVSYGGGYNLNPFKDSKTKVAKPFTLWLYADASNQMPSGTGIVSLNPFEIKTLTGAQMGFMLRFRGLYIHVAQPLSQTSYTFFIGTARYAGGFEFTPLSSIFENFGN